MKKVYIVYDERNSCNLAAFTSIYAAQEFIHSRNIEIEKNHGAALAEADSQNIYIDTLELNEDENSKA